MSNIRISTGPTDPVYAGVLINNTYSGVRVVRDDTKLVVTLDIADGQAFELVTKGPVVIKHMQYEPPTSVSHTASGGGGGGGRRY